MTPEQLVKKKKKPKRSSENVGRGAVKKTFPTLAHIVLKSGLKVEIPELPMNISELTSYDHLHIALEYAALVICSLNRLESRKHPELKLILTTFQDTDWIRTNLEDSLNHLHYAIEGFHKEKGQS